MGVRLNKEGKSPLPFVTGKSNFEAIETAIKNGQVLINYIAEKGIKPPEGIINRIITAKYLLLEKNWSIEEETKFWLAYNQLSKWVLPVTIESLKAVKPDKHKKGRIKTQATKAVWRYSIFAILSLFVLLMIHIYWFIGHSSTKNLKEYFDQENDIILKIQDFNAKGSNNSTPSETKDHSSIEKLSLQLKHIQELKNANYIILVNWSAIWRGLFNNEDPFTPIKETNFSKMNANNLVTKNLIEAPKDKREKSNPTTYKYDEEQIYLTELSSEYAVETLQSYFLPLLYGLLGAAIFVLRDLNQEIKRHIYSKASDTNYNLRLAIGALAGLSISYFVTPGMSASDKMSTFALSFLTGYNVEILFSLMDRLIASFSKQVSSSSDKKR